MSATPEALAKAREWAEQTFAQFYAVCTQRDIAEQREMLAAELRDLPSRIDPVANEAILSNSLLTEVLDAYEARLVELLALASRGER